MGKEGGVLSVRKLFGFDVFDVCLTPSTVGQFEVGDKYGARGKVVRVRLTEISVAVPDAFTSKENEKEPKST